MDHYKTLMVSRTATQEEIQKAYHTLALKYHPDANPGDASASEKIKEVNKAYQVLRRADTRKEYDATLEGRRVDTQKKAGAPPRSAAASAAPVYATGNPLADILGSMRGSARENLGGQTSAKENGEAKSSGPPTVEIKLTAREAATGTTKTILVNGSPLRIKISITP